MGGEPDGKRQQHELQDQRAFRGTALLQRMDLGGVEGALGHGNRAGKASHCDRSPLVRGHLGLLAIGECVGEAIAKRQILRIEIGGLVCVDGRRKRRRQLHPPRRCFQRLPGDFDAASQFRISLLVLRRQLAGSEPVRHQQRCLTGRVAQQPSGLLDH